MGNTSQVMTTGVNAGATGKTVLTGFTGLTGLFLVGKQIPGPV